MHTPLLHKIHFTSLQDEYYSLLADRIYKIQKDLEMHKFKKGMEQKQLQTDPQGRLVHNRKVPGTNLSFMSANCNSSNFGDSLAMNMQDRANIHLMPPNDMPASLQGTFTLFWNGFHSHLAG